MRFGWFDLLLAALASIVVTLVGIWAWESFRDWRINRKYSPNRRKGPRGRRHYD